LTDTSNPAGLSVDAGGIITGGTDGTDYTITDTNTQGCSACDDPFPFNAGIQLPAPPQPTVTVTPEDCSADATNVVTNYDATLTYTSNPAGLSVGAGGIITGGTDGTNYTITATNTDGCSAVSAPFAFNAGTQLPMPAAPAANAQAFCDTDSPTGNDLVPAISASITWYSDAGLTTVVNGADALTAGTYYVT